MPLVGGTALDRERFYITQALLDDYGAGVQVKAKSVAVRLKDGSMAEYTNIASSGALFVGETF